MGRSQLAGRKAVVSEGMRCARCEARDEHARMAEEGRRAPALRRARGRRRRLVLQPGGSALGYTQSAVSQQIAALERIVGQKLVHRPGGQRAVTLTDAGALLLEHVHAIGTRLAAAEADLGALADGERGTLRVGSFQAAGARILPRSCAGS